ncbi:hypothetical protein C8F01DRAFT_1105980 [Mycena amicta]|nr:hypothetical protein C8F01DRAFT_1105980 [Mycena amicta]
MRLGVCPRPTRSPRPHRHRQSAHFHCIASARARGAIGTDAGIDPGRPRRLCRRLCREGSAARAWVRRLGQRLPRPEATSMASLAMHLHLPLEGTIPLQSSSTTRSRKEPRRATLCCPHHHLHHHHHRQSQVTVVPPRMHPHPSPHTAIQHHHRHHPNPTPVQRRHTPQAQRHHTPQAQRHHSAPRKATSTSPGTVLVPRLPPPPPSRGLLAPRVAERKSPICSSVCLDSATRRRRIVAVAVSMRGQGREGAIRISVWKFAATACMHVCMYPTVGVPSEQASESAILQVAVAPALPPCYLRYISAVPGTPPSKIPRITRPLVFCFDSSLYLYPHIPHIVI